MDSFPKCNEVIKFSYMKVKYLISTTDVDNEVIAAMNKRNYNGVSIDFNTPI